MTSESGYLLCPNGRSWVVFDVGNVNYSSFADGPSSHTLGQARSDDKVLCCLLCRLRNIPVSNQSGAVPLYPMDGAEQSVTQSQGVLDDHLEYWLDLSRGS
jgi:hypothetical protein